MWKCIGLDSFACGFRFWSNLFSVFRFWMIFSTVLRFLTGPNAPLLNGLVKLFGSSRNGFQLHMDYAVIHRKVSYQFFCFYYETVSWITINFAIILLFAWFTSILTLEFIFFFQCTKDVGKIRRKREKLLHYTFPRENNGTFFSLGVS